VNQLHKKLQIAQAQITQLSLENEQLKAETQKFHTDWRNYHQQSSQSLENMQTKLYEERKKADKLRQEKQELHKDVLKLHKELSNRVLAEKANSLLPDLYAIRDQVISQWKLARRAESKERLREFADRMIADILKANGL